MTGIGISGTRHGCNSAQYTELEQLLEDAFDFAGGVFHHGDCVGVDEEAHRIAKRLDYWIIVHPPLNPKHRAFCDGDESRNVKSYLDRNRDIVDESRSMLIVPEKAILSAPRSGTWATYKYALETGTPVQVIVGGRFEFSYDSDALPVRMPPL